MKRPHLLASLLPALVVSGVCAYASSLAAQELSGPVPAVAPAVSVAGATAPVADPSVLATPAALDPAAKAQLSRLLKTRHACPPREAFEALGVPAITPELYRIARDPSVFPLYRHRALEALGYWPDDQVRELYVQVLASATNDAPLQHDMLALSVSVFESGAISVVEPYLDDPRIAVRLSVLRALAKLADPAARKIVEARAQNDPDERVRLRASNMLSR